jgi:hypothetical protein
VLTSAGYELWPIEMFIDQAPGPRNDVHYDLIVAAGADLPDDLIAGDKAARRAARAQLAPRSRLCSPCLATRCHLTDRRIR